MVSRVLFSSKKSDWETPQVLFDTLNEEFKFELDVAASKTNHKCKKFYTPKDNGLIMPWSDSNWCNPPYGRQIYNWVKKANDELTNKQNLTVMLIPARTDTKWFHEFIYNKPWVDVRFLKGRLKFEIDGKPLLDKNGKPQPATFPSMLVIFGG